MHSSALAERLRAACTVPATFALRLQGEGDQDFLRQLFVSRRWSEACAMPGWNDEQRLAFLHSQADLQQRHYAQHYSNAAFLIVEQQDQPVGRLCVNAQSNTLRLVDIALMPEWQQRGVGTGLLLAVIALADQSGACVELAVDRFSPAQRLYRRHGFEAMPGDDGFSLHMRRPACLQQERAP